MKYNFDRIIDRRNSYSKKWEKYRNTDIIAMSVADMEFSAPQPVLDALRQELEHGILGYSLYQTELKSIVTDYLDSQYNWKVMEQEIIWLPGVVAGMNISCKIFTAPDQPLVTATPIYPPFFSTASNNTRQQIQTALINNGNGWKWDFEDLEKQLSEQNINGGMLLLCNPHNPTGRVWSQQELEQLLEITSRYNLKVCSDEIHCDLILDKKLKHIPFANLNPEAAQKSIVLMSPAKTFNIPGLSCAFAVIQNDMLRHQFETYIRGLYPQINIMGLIACKTALTQCHEWKTQLLDYLRYNHDLAVNSLTSIADLSLSRSEATYLLWINASKLCKRLNINNSFQLFENHGVALGNGADFGNEAFFRLNFACPREQLTEALARITLATADK